MDGRMTLLFAVLFALLVVQGVHCAVPTKLNYKLNEEYNYNLKSNVDGRGRKEQTSSGGVTATMNAILAVKPVEFKDNKYLFVMNMFNTEVGVDQSAGTNSNIETVSLGDAQPLGENMYYSQTLDGQITEIWYYKDDSPYFVQIKLGAINSLQTKIVGTGSKLDFTETDPVGIHITSVTGSGSDSLVLTRNFNEKDFKSFSDANLKSENLKLEAQAVTTVHSEGHIIEAKSSQTVWFKNLSPQKKTDDSNAESLFNMDLSSKGNLDIAITTTSVEHFQDSHSYQSLKDTKDMVKSSLFERSVALASFAMQAATDLDIDEEMAKIPSFGHGLTADVDQKMTMHRIIDYFNARDADVFNAKAKSLTKMLDLVKESDESNNASYYKVYESLLFILNNVEKKSDIADKFVAGGLMSQDEKTIMMNLLAIGSGKRVVPFKFLKKNLVRFFKSNVDDVRVTSVLAFSAAVSRQPRLPVNAMIYSRGILLEMLDNAMEKGDNHEVSLIVHAMGNAGPKLFKMGDFASRGLFASSNLNIKLATHHALRKFNVPGGYQLIGDSDFPYNKTYEKGVKYGGDAIGVEFEVEFFLGTNFDCNHEYFNYEALAKAEADIYVLSDTITAFLAEAVYGKENGQIIGDEIILKFFSDVLYDKKIPNLDCATHTYEIAHTAPGFHYSYTLWVEIIPIIFTVGVDLKLDLSWGWCICDTKLSAMVELLPSATLTAYGSAVIDLLIIKAGVELDASFNAEIIPQATVTGSLCEVGIDAQLKTVPMTAKFLGYYVWKHCKFLIFDCKWGKHHQEVWWSWTEPAHDDILYQKTWKIAK